MDILFITKEKNLFGLASRLVDEGHNILMWAPMSKNTMFEPLKSLYDAIKQCKFIISDGIGQQEYGWAKTFNKPVIGSCPLANVMNHDCVREYKMAHKLGISLPVTEVLEDLSSAYDKVLNWNPVRTSIRYDRENITVDHQQWMAWALTQLPVGKEILIQQPTYGEVSKVSGWFDGMNWKRPFILTNPQSELQANMSLGLFQREWINKVIVPYEKYLRTVEYKGPFSVTFSTNKEGNEVLCTHAGFEYPLVYGYFEGLKTPCGEFLNEVAFSTNSEVDYTTDYVASLLVKTSIKESKGIPIVGITDGNRKHIFLNGVFGVEDDIVVSGDTWIYAVTAHGRDPEEAFGRAYFTADKVRIPQPVITPSMASLGNSWVTKLKRLELL